MSDWRIRDATPGDRSQIASIYGYYVKTSSATFELEPPDQEEIGRRMDAVIERGLPYLVLEHVGSVVGYAYATSFRSRAAYLYTVENSVYVDADCTGMGFGRALLAMLIERCREAGAKQMVAVIGGENPASVALHASQGFAHVGILRGVGYKNEQWLDLTLIQREL